MKYRDPETGELKEISVKAADTLPIGTIVDYDGTEVPDGWEKVDDDYKIKMGKCIKLSKNEEQQIAAGGSYTKITWQNEEINTSNGLLTFENNSIKIGKDVNVILVTAMLQNIMDTYDPTKSSSYLKIMKQTQAGELIEISNAQNNESTVYNNTLAMVQEGDLIYIETYFTTKGKISKADRWNNFNVIILS